MQKINLHIEPNEKYRAVVEDELPGDELPDTEEEWREQHPAPDAANAFTQKTGGAPVESGRPDVEDLVDVGERIEDLGDGEYRISCRACGQGWRMEDHDTKKVDPREDLKSRLEAHRPCDERVELSWDRISPASDPDLLAKIATYFDGISPDESTERLRAKLRLLDCDVYINAQLAARGELQQ